MALAARVVEQQAADGTPIFDVVVDAADGSERAIYRGPDFAHVESVRADIESGRLDPFEVQKILQNVEREKATLERWAQKLLEKETLVEVELAELRASISAAAA